MTDYVILNCKTYESATGEKSVELARICEEVSEETSAEMIICPQHMDLYRVAQEVSIPVYGQHIDAIEFGSNTGHVLGECLKEAGASGCLINHSEMRLKLADIEANVKKLRELGLTSIVCANNVEVTKAVAALEPDFVAIEPPKLIGTGVSVSEAQPEVITAAVDAAKEVNPDVPVLTGAGITTGEDVNKALELGTKGVLLASGVTKAEDPKEVLEGLVEDL